MTPPPHTTMSPIYRGGHSPTRRYERQRNNAVEIGISVRLDDHPDAGQL
jgi:hypothetical protein